MHSNTRAHAGLAYNTLPPSTIARLAGRASIAAYNKAGSGAAELSDRGCASAFNQTPSNESISQKYVLGKLRMRSGTMSKGVSPPKAGNLEGQNPRAIRLSILGSLGGSGQSAKGSGHSRL